MKLQVELNRTDGGLSNPDPCHSDGLLPFVPLPFFPVSASRLRTLATKLNSIWITSERAPFMIG